MEMCDDIYANVDTIQPSASKTTADQNPKSSPGYQHSGRKLYRWTAVCLGLLCVLLLTAITLLCIHYNGVVNETMEKHRELSETLSLLTANYTAERDQLETINTILKKQRDQLSIDKDRFQKIISELAVESRVGSYKALLRGIGEFPFPQGAQPCQLQLSGENAIPLAVSPSGHVLLAASRYGRGKVVVAAHEDYIQGAIVIPAFGQFVKNAIEWLKPHSHAAVGVSGMSYLADHLTKSGFKVKSISNYDGTVGVFCREAYSDEQVQEVLDFVRGGGGLLIGGQAWHWASQDPGLDVLQEFPGNKFTRPAGISFTSKYADRGTFKVPQEIPIL
ncbi:TRPM8 channel-associated factor homolog [Megalops cyprinoides]|uniref:TRPM8 channel-associated factor homolog n=1 Tax=Megalops cyprinoides TaxID=118141 RepID=UPI0018640B61|nr:TRPM8 channel-associated factor homolog [Megalops cyprinoides]